MSNDDGSVITVDGPIDPSELGITLPHEHLFAEWSGNYSPPDSVSKRRIANEPISLENRWYLESEPFSHKENLFLDSFRTIVEEVSRYHRSGGDSIVELTPKNIGSDPRMAKAVSRETGLNVIQGTAYYTHRDSEYPNRIYSMGVDDVCQEFVSDIRSGIGKTNVRAGIIGEIGLSGRIHEQEEKILRAAGRAAVITGAPISIHPPGQTEYSRCDETYSTSRWGLEVLDILEEEGVSPSQVAISHMDRSQWYNDLSRQKEIADRGAYVEYDLFGKGPILYKEADDDAFQSDIQRVECLLELIEDGYQSNILISQDVFAKYRLTTYGGLGYAHILDNVLPVFASKGINQDVISEIMEENPKRFLTFTGPA